MVMGLRVSSRALRDSPRALGAKMICVRPAQSKEPVRSSASSEAVG